MGNKVKGMEICWYVRFRSYYFYHLPVKVPIVTFNCYMTDLESLSWHQIASSRTLCARAS